MSVCRFLTFAILPLAGSLCSCAPSVYFPDKVVSTGFRQQGDGKVWLSAKPQFNGNDTGGKSGTAFSTTVSAAYAFGARFGAYAHYSSLRNRTVSESREIRSLWTRLPVTGGNFNGSKWETALVYYKPVAKDQVVELSAGYSSGDIARSSRLTDSNNFSTRYNTFFVQPGWTVFERGLTFSMGGKIWVQRFHSFEGSTFVRRSFTDGKTFLTDKLFYGLQPYMSMDAGTTYVRFSCQISAPMLFRPADYGIPLAGFPLHLCVGVAFQLDKQLFSQSK